MNIKKQFIEKTDWINQIPNAKLLHVAYNQIELKIEHERYVLNFLKDWEISVKIEGERSHSAELFKVITKICPYVLLIEIMGKHHIAINNPLIEKLNVFYFNSEQYLLDSGILFPLGIDSEEEINMTMGIGDSCLRVRVGGAWFFMLKTEDDMKNFDTIMNESLIQMCKCKRELIKTLIDRYNDVEFRDSLKDSLRKNMRFQLTGAIGEANLIYHHENGCKTTLLRVFRGSSKLEPENIAIVKQKITRDYKEFRYQSRIQYKC